MSFLQPLLKPAFWVIVVSLLAGLYVYSQVPPQWQEHRASYQVYANEQGQLSYTFKGEEVVIPDVVPYAQSPLRQEALDRLRGQPQVQEQWVVEQVVTGGTVENRYSQLSAKFHFGVWSLLPALVGTTIKPLADKNNISHEELAYIVDSTASPISLVLAFNAWPAYVQALIFVPGVTFLSTEAERISFSQCSL